MMLRNIFLFILCGVFLVPGVSQSVEVGDKLPVFRVKDMDGNMVDLEKIIGHGPLLLVFWASWCPNCKTEVPKVNEMVETYSAKGMTFVGINVGFNDSQDRARKFMKKTGMNYPVIFDEEGTLSKAYKVFGVPTIIVADSQGIIRFKKYSAPEISEAQYQELKQ